MLVALACRSVTPGAPPADPRLTADGLVLRDFDSLSWDGIGRDAVPLPPAIAAAVAEDRRLRFRDRARFRDEVLSESRRLGVDPEGVAALSPREAVVHAVDVVTSRLEFALVDSPEFAEKYPARLFPDVDVYFHEREGDCDKYRDLVIAVFDLFRERSPARLGNVHVVSQAFGGRDEPHAWNAVLLAFPDRIEVAHFDPTWYDGGASLEGGAEHVSSATFRASFLTRVGALEDALAEIGRAMRKVDRWTRGALLAKKAAIELRLAESGRGSFDAVLKTYSLALVEEHDGVYSRHFDRILASAVRAYAALGRNAAARRTFDRLERTYPRSVFRAVLVRDRSLARVLGPSSQR